MPSISTGGNLGVNSKSGAFICDTSASVCFLFQPGSEQGSNIYMTGSPSISVCYKVFKRAVNSQVYLGEPAMVGAVMCSFAFFVCLVVVFRTLQDDLN